MFWNHDSSTIFSCPHFDFTYFQILQGKVQRLEHLLHLKDIRIEDLSSRVELLEGKLQSVDPEKTKKPPRYKPGGQVVKAGGGYGRR